MRLIPAAACLAAIALAGCKQEPSVKMTNATPEQVMNQQVAAVKLQPGEWEITAEVKDMKMTGAPAGAPMPQQAKVVTKTCLTPAQAEKPTDIMGQGPLAQFKDSCVYDSFEMKGGRIDAAVHCTMPQGMKVEAKTHGTFSATAMNVESESNVTGMPGGMSVSSKTEMTGKRIGDCPASPAS